MIIVKGKGFGRLMLIASVASSTADERPLLNCVCCVCESEMEWRLRNCDFDVKCLLLQRALS